MAFIKYYPQRTTGIKHELYLESDIRLDYTVMIPESGTQLDVYENEKLVAQIDGNCIKIQNQQVPEKKYGVFNWAWEFKHPQKIEIRPENDNFYSDGDVIGFVSTKEASTGILDLIFNFRNSVSEEGIVKLNYQDHKLNTLIALCLLLVKVSRRFHTI
ncbi:hypothetical protein [Flocculibacter collagenilyticus]|uniref:hypothetical protein n=1 Tax=Flocculibacter collagenilyticus TaxID=2744479 RepID=UPI0018F2AA50|nr:hypothetical protein [Flocculibacter collagenilyticus]